MSAPALSYASDHTIESVARKVFDVQSEVLPNGLHVIRHHRDFSDTLTLQLVVDVGFQDFTCEFAQAPHVLEHMLFEGTKRFDRKALRQRIRDHGGLSNGYTTEEYTYYTLDIHSSYPKIGFENLYSMVSEPLFNPEDLARTRSVIHSEFGTSANKLQLALARKRVVKEVAKARIYVGSNLECPEITSPDSVSMDLIKSIFARDYVPGNMTLIVMGHFDDAEVSEAIQATLAKLEAKPVPVRAPVHFGKIDYLSPLVENRGLFDPEVDISLYIPAPGSIQPENDAYRIVAEYLGEQLFYDVRGQRGMAYTPLAKVDNNSQYGLLEATTRTSSQWADEVIALFREKYAEIRANGVPEEDVVRLRRKLILEFESKQRYNLEQAQLYRHYRHQIREHGKMPDLVERMQKVDAAAVKQVLDTSFPPQPLITEQRAPTGWEAALRIVPASMLFAAVILWLMRRANRKRFSQKRL
ncbi:Predicted peptidase M16 [gamma proteobacterium HdN1]|nr:Predicted peptidase M16 [gamma proteobacterium HdN1]